MANIPNLNAVTGLTGYPPTTTIVVNAAVLHRHLVASPIFGDGSSSGGGPELPVGPQRWPLKL